jgi:hypothetical protein
MISDYKWFFADFAGVFGEAHVGIVHFYRLHRLTSSPPIRTTFRSLTPTANTGDHRIGFFLHFVVYP